MQNSAEYIGLLHACGMQKVADSSVSRVVAAPGRSVLNMDKVTVTHHNIDTDAIQRKLGELKTRLSDPRNGDSGWFGQDYTDNRKTYKTSYDDASKILDELGEAANNPAFDDQTHNRVVDMYNAAQKYRLMAQRQARQLDSSSTVHNWLREKWRGLRDYFGVKQDADFTELVPETSKKQ